MELKALHQYSTADFDLAVGATTVDMNISDEKKAQMLADFPEWFEEFTGEAAKVEAPVVVEEVIVEAPVEAPVVVEEVKSGKKGK